MSQQQQHAVVTEHEGHAPTEAPKQDGPGVQRVQALLRTGATDPKPIAQVITAHPAERDAILTVLHESVGNAFVGEVMTLANPAAATPAPRDAIKGDVIDERLAHGLAYRDASELTDEDRMYLQQQGLQVGKVIHGAGGLDMTTFIPTAGSHSVPVLAFRGTRGAADLADDVNPAGVGAYQMAANEGLIAQTLASLSAYGLPTVTGHSLGGSLAQMSATRFPGAVGRVVTFQSPGIPKDMVQKLDQHNAEAKKTGGHVVESQHYQVHGDFVPLAGQAFTSGFMTVIEFPNAGLIHEHGSHPLQEVDAGGEAKITTTPVDGEVAGPHKLRNFVDALRVGAGRVVETVERIGNVGKAPRETYVQLWEQVRAAVDRGAKPDAIAGLIQSGSVDPQSKQLMLDNLREIEAAAPR